MVVGINLPSQSVGFAAFGAFPSQHLDGVAVCEVSGYGERSLKKEYMDIFRDWLEEKIQEPGAIRTERIVRKQTADDQILSEIHMQAIISDDKFKEAEANMVLYRYWQKQSKKELDEDRLTGEQKEWVQKYGARKKVKHLVFCNIKEFDVEVKRSGAYYYEDDLRKMKMKMGVDYCVIECQTGKISRGHSFTDKSMGIVDLLIVRYGKQVSPEQLLHTIIDVQTSRIGKDIIGIVT